MPPLFTQTNQLGSEPSFCEFEPHPALAPFVDRFWARTDDSAEPSGPRRILPDGCIDIIVSVLGDRRFVVGAMTRATVFLPERRSKLIAVRFRPGGAAPFLKIPAHELTDRRVATNEVGLRWLSSFSVAENVPLAMGVRALERVLLERVPSIAAVDMSVMHAVTALFGPHPPSIEALATELGWSRQHLARTIRAHVGISPVRLARVARLQRAVDLLQRGPSPHDARLDARGLAAAALRLGFFDQAHMARDFKDLAGVTPHEARRSRGSIFPIRSLLVSP